ARGEIMSETHDNLREAVALTPGQRLHAVDAKHFRPNGWVEQYPSWDDYDAAGQAAWELMAADLLSALSVPEGWRKALEFYRDAWSLVTEGDEPDPVYGGGGITSQYLEPSTALLDDQGKRARDALSAIPSPGGEGSSLGLADQPCTSR